MKKAVCVVISGVIAFSLAACVPAPKNSIPDSTVNKTTAIESVKIQTSETSQTENSELQETITTTTTTSESLPTYEFDALQNIFININENTTASDLETFIDQYALAYTVEDYNGSNIVRKKTTYQISYTEGSASQRYADSGDYIEVSFNKSDGSILYAVYSDVKSWKSALFYNYGIWFSFQFDSPSEYTGNYIVAPLEKEDGIVIKYDNGHETTTNYFKCDSAEDSIKAVIDDKREG